MTNEAAKPTAAIQTKAWDQLPRGLPQMRACLHAMRSEIAKALPRSMPAERFMRVALSCLSTGGKQLAECTTLSVVGGVVLAAQLGLELGGPLGQAYLVPHEVKGVKTAVFIPGYRGMIDLSRRSGSVSVIEAVVVHKRDKFTVVQGTGARIEHVPYLGEGEPGAAYAVYALARFRDGTSQFVVMTKREVESIKRRSKGAGSSFSGWKTDEEEMWKKTAIRRLWKVLPVSVEKAMAKAIVAHDRAETGDPIAGDAVFSDVDVFGSDEEPVEGEFVNAEADAKADDGAQGAAGEPTPERRTRKTTKAEGEKPAGDAAKAPDPDDPAEELRKIHERIRAEDPVSFAGAWDAPAASVDLSTKSVDEMVAAREIANELAAARANILRGRKV